MDRIADGATGKVALEDIDVEVDMDFDIDDADGAASQSVATAAGACAPDDGDESGKQITNADEDTLNSLEEALSTIMDTISRITFPNPTIPMGQCSEVVAQLSTAMVKIGREGALVGKLCSIIEAFGQAQDFSYKAAELSTIVPALVHALSENFSKVPVNVRILRSLSVILFDHATVCTPYYGDIGRAVLPFLDTAKVNLQAGKQFEAQVTSCAIDCIANLCAGAASKVSSKSSLRESSSMLEDFCGRLRAILAILTGKPIAEEDSGSAAVLACTVRCISTLATVKPELMSRQAHGVEVLSNLQGVLSFGTQARAESSAPPVRKAWRESSSSSTASSPPLGWRRRGNPGTPQGGGVSSDSETDGGGDYGSLGVHQKSFRALAMRV